MTIAATILRQRIARERCFPGLPEPAWLMMLDIAAHGPQPIGNLSIGAFLPHATALRHLRALADCGLAERKIDPTDTRRVFIHLTTNARFGLASFEQALAA